MKNKDKEYDVQNPFVGATLCVKVSESNNNEDLEEWLLYSGVLSHTKHTKMNLTNIKEYNIDVTVGSGQKMKCNLKGTVNMKLQGRGNSTVD